MAQYYTVQVQLTANGLGTGPFDVYSVDANGNLMLLAIGVPPSGFLGSGFTVQVPRSAVSVRVQSTNATCDNYQDIPIPIQYFRSTWTTTVPYEQISLPLTSNGTYDFYVDWGDGSPVVNVTTWNDTDAFHTYVVAGTYTVQIYGVINGIGWNVSVSERKLTSISVTKPEGSEDQQEEALGSRSGLKRKVFNRHGLPDEIKEIISPKKLKVEQKDQPQASLH